MARKKKGTTPEVEGVTGKSREQMHSAPGLASDARELRKKSESSERILHDESTKGSHARTLHQLQGAASVASGATKSVDSTRDKPKKIHPVREAFADIAGKVGRGINKVRTRIREEKAGHEKGSTEREVLGAFSGLTREAGRMAGGLEQDLRSENPGQLKHLKEATAHAISTAEARAHTVITDAKGAINDPDSLSHQLLTTFEKGISAGTKLAREQLGKATGTEQIRSAWKDFKNSVEQDGAGLLDVAQAGGKLAYNVVSAVVSSVKNIFKEVGSSLMSLFNQAKEETQEMVKEARSMPKP